MKDEQEDHNEYRNLVDETVFMVIVLVVIGLVMASGAALVGFAWARWFA